MKSIVWFIPAFLVFLGILLLSTALSIPVQIEGIAFTDKINHAFAYLVLVVSSLIAFEKNDILNVRSWLILVLCCVAYGVILEIVQLTFFPNRYFEWWDAAANVTGTLIGSLGFRLFTNVRL